MFIIAFEPLHEMRTRAASRPPLSLLSHFRAMEKYLGCCTAHKNSSLYPKWMVAQKIILLFLVNDYWNCRGESEWARAAYNGERGGNGDKYAEWDYHGEKQCRAGRRRAHSIGKLDWNWMNDLRLWKSTKLNIDDTSTKILPLCVHVVLVYLHASSSVYLYSRQNINKCEMSCIQNALHRWKHSVHQWKFGSSVQKQQN